jgi:hypothetical protein
MTLTLFLKRKMKEKNIPSIGDKIYKIPKNGNEYFVQRIKGISINKDDKVIINQWSSDYDRSLCHNYEFKDNKIINSGRSCVEHDYYYTTNKKEADNIINKNIISNAVKEIQELEERIKKLRTKILVTQYN